MEQYNISQGTYFYAIGLSYKKADAEIRGHFSLDKAAIAIVSKPHIAWIFSESFNGKIIKTQVQKFQIKLKHDDFR